MATLKKTCDTCGEEKPRNRNSFRRSKVGTENKYSDTCLKCLLSAEDAQFALVSKDHKRERNADKIEKAVANKRKGDRERAAKVREEKNEKKKELARRVLSRRKLVHFIKRFHPGYMAGWVHHDICRRLEKFLDDVEKGLGPRLMLFMPPRHGKSEIASNYFPSFALGHHPEFEIIASSYAVSLPIGFSRKVRERLQDPAYRALFTKTTLSKDSKSAEAWQTTMGGGYVAAGVGGGITGKGAHILIIDDPIKDAEEADSETIRDKVWDWYGSTAYTRLAPGGGVLVIQTRWHDDDLSGRLIQQMKDLEKEGVPQEEIDKWEIIEYPAEATNDEYLNRDRTITDKPKYDNSIKLRLKGDALHPDRFPIERLRRIRRSLQPRHWSALYQQNPVPDDGIFFTKDMFRISPSIPALNEMRLFAAWDLAIGEKQTNDWTVGVVGGLDYDDQIHIVDMIRFRGDTHQIVEAILNVEQKYSPDLTGIEKGQLEHAIKPTLRKRMRERRLFPTLAEGDKALVPITDKLKRARPLQGRMQQGMVYFNGAHNWVETAQHEMLRFPGGVHDDIVDALAWLVRMMMGESPPRRPKAKRKKSWQDKLKNIGKPGRSPMAA